MYHVKVEWVRAEDAHKNLEGRQAWQYCERDDTLIIVTVPKNFSRVPHHCLGIWWMEIVRPAPPIEALVGG